ncbi:amidohydrolase family protein [Tautonia plasticadhaerens]|uniref:Imidazolonepropionase n=1 Tax=Tautonia plasticadhaerens TaxID=2527974 RepID=A0A518HE96_9BACT|nr:amidohydrolase family protein [Tautonia plasticadhaerens]QDV39160.1 imidazolonepropionase [Tautonia plasticadhaerens]QDV39168.1 imidazolonepropionase [Tautonia plasticadhaerens]
MAHPMITHPLGLAALATAQAIAGAGSVATPARDEAVRTYRGLEEINPPAEPEPGPPTAIVGARLIDGRGGPAIPDAAVVIRGATIVAAGPRAGVEIPEDARVVEAAGLSLLPGLIDAHFHHDRDDPGHRMLRLSLSRGVTTLRDPGHPIPAYQAVREAPGPLPRCFLTGRHLDQQPHAHPDDAEAIRTAAEARAAVGRRVAAGASAIKVYYRLPPELIGAASEAAHARGVPVTAHLELVDAGRAIEAGVDGVEHVTSFGTALAEPEPAATFRAAVERDNEARHEGRYRLWATIEPEDNPRLGPLIEGMVAGGVVLSPTLAVFERRAGDRGVEGHHVRGFEAMLRFVGHCHEAGVPIVVGSHTWAPHAEEGGAYQRELELLVECGLTPGDAIVAATSRNAEYLGCADRLGAIAAGRQADVILVAGDPLEDIAAMGAVRGVMLNGRWVGQGGGSARRSGIGDEPGREGAGGPGQIPRRHPVGCPGHAADRPADRPGPWGWIGW